MLILVLINIYMYSRSITLIIRIDVVCVREVESWCFGDIDLAHCPLSIEYPQVFFFAEYESPRERRNLVHVYQSGGNFFFCLLVEGCLRCVVAWKINNDSVVGTTIARVASRIPGICGNKQLQFITIMSQFLSFGL